MTSALSSTFNVIEWLAITGLAQSVLILVYIIFRVRVWRQAALALAYFAILGGAFGLQFALRLEEYAEPLRLAQWLCRVMGPPLCTLLVLQVARGAELPPRRSFWVLVLPFIALAAGLAAGRADGVCDKGGLLCPDMFQWLGGLGSISGGLALMALWAHKDIFSGLRKAKGGMERYWLVITLLVANVGALGIGVFHTGGGLETGTADALFVVLDMAFIYLASTTLFRVYPSPVQLSAAPTRFTAPTMTEEEKSVAAKVKKLMEVDKLYHEPTFSRADLAREVNVSENTLSRVINVAFGKSFPRMLNEYRVDDAKRMLHDPDIAIQVVATEVGFNSLASFNRAFREIAGITPSQYRQNLDLPEKAAAESAG